MGHRLITIDAFREQAKRSGQHDARGGAPVRKDAGCIEKAADGKTLFVLSTSAPDRSNDVVEQTGWQLENYRPNPVVLFAHDSGSPPVGMSPNIYVDQKGRLVSEGPVFATADVSPFGAMIGKMVEAGFLRAASVGFIPLEWTFNEDRGFYAMDFKRQELIEWSVVPVPANPEALVGGSKSAGIDLAPMLAWASKAMDEKRAPGMLELDQVAAVYKALAPRQVQVTREPGAATVCMCDAGPLVKCQECGGHKRAAISDDAYPKDGDKAVEDLARRVRVLEAEHQGRVDEAKRAPKPSAEEEKKAFADELRAAVKAETDQLLGKVS